MSWLIDTGVLLRMFRHDDPEHRDVRDSMRILFRQGGLVTVAMQNIAEFWNVATRPIHARGGHGWSLTRVEGRVRWIERRFSIVTESPAAYAIWIQLLRSLSVVGVQVHDARLAAIMMAEGIEDLLTLNPADFKRYPAIRCHTPAQFVSANHPKS